MKYYLKIIFLLFLIKSGAKAQLLPGAKQTSLANSVVALANNAFATFYNPAGLAQLNNTQFAAFYSPSPFGFKQLSTAYIALEFPLGIGNIGFGAMNYGFSLYKNVQLNFSFSFAYSRKYFFGAAFDVNSLKITRYGSSTKISFDFGFIAKLKKDFKIGFSVVNLLHQSFLKKYKSIPTIINFGFAYLPIKNLSLSFAFCKDLEYPVSFRVGIEYTLLKYLSLRIGTKNHPDAFTCGLGVAYKGFMLDFAIFTHSYFEATKQFSLIIDF